MRIFSKFTFAMLFHVAGRLKNKGFNRNKSIFVNIFKDL